MNLHQHVMEASGSLIHRIQRKHERERPSPSLALSQSAPEKVKLVYDKMGHVVARGDASRTVNTTESNRARQPAADFRARSAMHAPLSLSLSHSRARTRTLSLSLSHGNP